MGGGRTDLALTTNTTSADGPTNTGYWTDTATQTALGVDFTNYTLSGTGTETDPYLIQSETDLAFLSWTIYNNKAYNGNVTSSYYFYSGKYFKQTKNLDLSAYYWQPIGIYYLRTGTTARRYFSGNYDGGGFTISGLYTPAGSGNAYSYQGLFGYVYGYSSTQATISNVGVIYSFIQGYRCVGGVVGTAELGIITITNCYNTGSVTGNDDYVGGVVGYAYATITKCYNTGSVTLTATYKENVGGVVGCAYNSTITNCYNTGSVTGSYNYVGGVVGWAYENVTITNCYNTGSVTGGSYVGGVVGWAYENVTITNCYNTGSVTGGSYVGGVAGYASSSSSSPVTIINCYNAGAVTSTSTSSYSYVGGVVGYAISLTIEKCYNTGLVEGNDENVCYIGGLVGYASSNITIKDCYNTNNVISTINSSIVDVYIGGLLGYIDTEDENSIITLISCHNTGAIVTTSTNARSGGMVGYIAASSGSMSISNCYNTGSVTGGSNVGGVVGFAIPDSSSMTLTIDNCYNTGTVTGSDDYVGGVVGLAQRRITIRNCYNTGAVTGNSSVGGAVGRAYNYSTITNCYNTGTVTGSSYVGGVVGAAYNYTITNCYNTGTVTSASTSSYSYVGGVVGYAGSLTISYTYYGGECTLTTGIGSSSGSATKMTAPVEEWAKNKAWYTNSSKWNSSYPWNFDTVWEFVKAPDYISNGYPVLQGIFPPAGTEIIYWTDDVAQNALGVDFTNYTLSGSGTETDPYQINSETDLAFLSWTIYTDNVYGEDENKQFYEDMGAYLYYPGVYFEQTKNLDLSAYYWQPIGIDYLRDGSSCKRYFAGSYIGCDFIVSGLYTPAMPEVLTAEEQNGYSNQGLFGVVSSTAADLARISNIYIKDSYFQGLDSIGSVVGCLYSHNVTNCYNFSTVKATGKHVGGIVGYTSSSSGRISISNCYNFSSIEGVDYVAGIVGYSGSNIDLQNNYNIGLIKGSGSVGGIAGYAWSNSTINNCFSNGTISAVSNVGGIVGATGNVTISGCGVETTQISGNSNVGVLVGYGNSSTTITNCYGIVGVDIDFASVGTYDNCVWITNVDGAVNKYYHGTDFSAFAWFNPNSCPIPKSLSSLGQFWTGDITPTLTDSSEWQEVV